MCMYRYFYTYSHTLALDTPLAVFTETSFFLKRGKLEFPSAVAAPSILLHPADSDAFTFADTTVNLPFRPEGSLVE